MSNELDDTINNNETPEDEKDLLYVNGIRKQIIEATFKNGSVPHDKIEAQLLIDSLKQLESVALARKRIKSDSEKSRSNEALAVTLAELIRKEVDPNSAAKGGGEIPDFPSEIISGIEIPDFETSNYKEQDYREFKNQHDIS
jgi:hypothetical protein